MHRPDSHLDHYCYCGSQPRLGWDRRIHERFGSIDRAGYYVVGDLHQVIVAAWLGRHLPR